MAQLDKLTLNNKIVEMRHSVRQSRIQSINKLVKEIQKLKAKKGTDEQKAKNLSKAERYVELIHIMKKVKDDDVSKFALINEKSLPQITNNVNELPEIKAIARIANHRPIYDKVKAFREQFIDWKEKLPILFETLGEKHQNKKKKTNPQKSKKNNTSVEKKSKNNENNDLKENPNITYIHNKLGTWLVQDIKSPTEQTSSSSDSFEKKDKPRLKNKKSLIENNVKMIKNTSKTQSNEIGKPTVAEEKTTKNISKEENIKEPTEQTSSSPDSFDKKDKSQLKNKKSLTENNVNSIKSSSRTQTNEIINLPVVEEKVTKNISKEDNNFALNEEKPTRTVDPFFVTKDNKEYLSVSVNNKVNVEVEKSNSSFKSKFKNNISKPTPPHEKTWKLNRVHEKKSYPVIEEKKVALHPSWEAKRKQTSITKFQGKKIKFDDE